MKQVNRCKEVGSYYETNPSILITVCIWAKKCENRRFNSSSQLQVLSKAVKTFSQNVRSPDLVYNAWLKLSD